MRVLIALLFCALGFMSKAQDLKGRDFWFTFPPNNEVNYNSPTASYYIYLLSDYCTEGTVEIPELGFSTTFTGDPGTYVEILLPNTAGGQSILHTAANAIQGKGIHIISDYPVAAFAVNYMQASVDGEGIIPTRWLGTKYVPVIRSYGSSSPTRVTIVATEDNTNINIDTWQNNGNPVTLTTTLNRGQTYMYQTTRNNCAGDNNTGYATNCQSLTASVINADKPIAVVGGNDCSSLLVCGACDALMTMMLPEDRWGTEYVTAQPVLRLPAQNLACLPGALNISIKSMADMLEIVGPVGTNVQIANLDGIQNLVIPAPPYDNGAGYGYGYIWYENPKTGAGLTGEANGEANTVITSSAPIEIAQYGKGWQTDGQNFTDPEAITLFPIDTWADSYLAATLRTPTTTLSEATLVVKDVGAPSPTTTMLQDGAAVGGAWQAIGDGTFKFIRVNTNMLATTRFENTSGAPFGLYQTARSAAESYSITGAFGGLLDQSCPGCPVADFLLDDACEGAQITIQNVAIDPKFNITEFKWDFGDGNNLTTATATNPTHIYGAPGAYMVQLIVTNDASPICSDTLELPITIIPSPIINAGPDAQICSGDSVWIGNTNPVVGNNPPYLFTWTPATMLNATDSSRALVNPTANTDYIFAAEDQLGCIGKDSVLVEVFPIDQISIDAHPPICEGATASISFTYSGTNPIEVIIRDSENNEHTITDILNGETLDISLLTDTKFWIKDAYHTPATGNSCLTWLQDSLELDVVPKPTGVIFPDLTLCSNMDSSLIVALTGNAPYTIFYSNDQGENGSLVSNTDSALIEFSALSSTTVFTLDSINYASFSGCTSFPNSSATVTVHPLPEAGDPMDFNLCMGQGLFNLFDTLSFASSPTPGGKWEDLDNSGGLNGNTIDPNVIGEGDFLFRYIVSGISPCSNDSATVLIHLNSAPSFGPQIETCLPGDAEYDVVSEISGGDPSSYLVTGGGTIAGTTFTSAPVTTDSPYEFIVSDGFACGTDTIAGTKKCACRTDAGTMNTTPLNFCEGEDIDLSGLYNSDFVDDGDDAYIFVLHDNGGPALGTIIQQNPNAPIFTFDPVLLTGTYYISPVAANASGATIDFNDGCLSVGPGVPINFFPLPTVQFGQDTSICLGGTASIAVSFTGFQPFGLVNAAGDSIGGLAAQDILSFNPLQDSVLHFVSVYNNRCSNAIDETINIDVNNSPRASISGTDSLCFDPTANLSFQVDLSGDGNLFNFTVEHSYPGGKDSIDYTNSPAGVNSLTLPITHLGKNSFRTIFVEDNGGGTCPGFNEGLAEVFVKPIPEIGFTLSKTALCLGQPQSINFTIAPTNQSYFVKIMDALTGSETSFTGVTNGSSFPLNTNTPGNHSITITEFYDLSNGPACNGNILTGSVDFLVNSAPTISISGDPQYCADEQNILLDVRFSGLPPFEFNIAQNGINIAPLNFITAQDSQVVVPAIVGNFAFTGSYLSDNSAGGCPGIGIDTLMVEVNPVPTVDMPLAAEICANENYLLNLNVSGNGPISVTIEDPDGNQLVITDWDENGAIDTLLPPLTDSTFIFVTQVADNSSPKTCFGAFADSLFIDVNPLPSASLRIASGFLDICDGSNGKIEIAISNTERAEVFYTELRTGASGSKTILASSGYRAVTISSPPLGWNYFRLDSIVSESGALCSAPLNLIDSLYVHPLPDVQFQILEPEICQGSPVNYTITSEGTLPIEFEFSNDPGQTQTLNAGTDSVQGQFNLNTSMDISLLNIQYSSAPFCTQNFNPAVHLDGVKVLDLPTGGISISKPEICVGEELILTLTGQGNASWQYILMLNGAILDSLESSLGVLNYLLPNETPGNHVLVLSEILDSKGCQSFPNDSIFYSSLPAPTVDFGLDNNTGCPPLTVQFENLTTDNFDMCVWDFGNGNRVAGSCQTISQSFVTPGFYDVSLQVTNSVGCSGILNLEKAVQVFTEPTADFKINPNQPTVRNSLVNFENTSANAIAYTWQVDSAIISTISDPIYQFPFENEGLYAVSLRAVSENGCVDSITKQINVEGLLSVNIPNSFTPDGDNMNEVFKPIILGYDTEFPDYRFRIYDRWGIVLFETDNLNQGWDGLKKDGTPHRADHYIYTVEIRSSYDATKESYRGSVHLIR